MKIATQAIFPVGRLGRLPAAGSLPIAAGSSARRL